MKVVRFATTALVVRFVLLPLLAVSRISETILLPGVVALAAAFVA